MTRTAAGSAPDLLARVDALLAGRPAREADLLAALALDLSDPAHDERRRPAA